MQLAGHTNRLPALRKAVFALALVGASVGSTSVAVPTASADGQCHDGADLYDTGTAGAFKQDRNMNGLVCDKVKLGPNGFHHVYSDDF